MYSTCIFCHGALGTNEVVEAFPIGRRLAFDAARGRLWVVCRRCERWNLTPLEERWEAIETCERLFRAARLRASTGQIGLARLTEGLELVRVGEPLRPEMAAWRYGDQFGRRRRKALIHAGAGLVLGGGLAAGGIAFGAPVAALWGLMLLGARRAGGKVGDVIALIPQAEGPSLAVKRGALSSARLAWEFGSRDWVLELGEGERMIIVRGAERVPIAGLLLPAMNWNGANARLTRDALALLEQHGSAEALFAAEAREWEGTTRMGYRDAPGGRVEYVAEGPRGFLARLEPAHRLALEMAAHEESERQALGGELALLEQAWKAAEEIAAIADSLLMPDSVRDAEKRLRSTS
jgi:hypothetical protein